MNGLTFLQKLMQHYPLPVIMISSLTPENGETAMRALAMGSGRCDRQARQRIIPLLTSTRIANSIRAAAVAKIPKSSESPRVKAVVFEDFHSRRRTKSSPSAHPREAPTRSREFLAALPVNAPGTVIVQHMPDLFYLSAFAKRLNSVCAMEVIEARDGDPVIHRRRAGRTGKPAYDAALERSRYVVRLEDGAPVQYQRPSIRCALVNRSPQAPARMPSECCSPEMGADGARGLLEMRGNRAHTIAQDEASSVVFGMPKEAIRAGRRVRDEGCIRDRIFGAAGTVQTRIPRHGSVPLRRIVDTSNQHGACSGPVISRTCSFCRLGDRRAIHGPEAKSKVRITNTPIIAATLSLLLISCTLSAQTAGPPIASQADEALASDASALQRIEDLERQLNILKAENAARDNDRITASSEEPAIKLKGFADIRAHAGLGDPATLRIGSSRPCF